MEASVYFLTDKYNTF